MRAAATASRRGGHGLAATLLLASLWSLGACASLPSAGGLAPSPGTLPSSHQSVRQFLYRLAYDGGDGRVTLRVVLRFAGDERFQLVASDGAGRAVFGLDFAAERAVLVDHRAAVFCVSGPELRLSELHPSELPLVALPRVLRGELPVPATSLAPSEARDDELVDPLGRSWRVGYEDGVLVRWTLLDASGPALWWTRQEDGGILSRRGGEQYRWTLIVAEDAAPPLADIVPEDFAEGVCGD